MDEFTLDAFVNRDEPIPVINLNVSGNDAPTTASSDSDSKRTRLKKAVSGSNLKNKLQHVTGSSSGTESGHSLQDRLFAKILQQVVPADDPGDEGEDITDIRSTRYINRPGFSLPLMTNNFRRFNARVGVAFVFQNRLIRLFTWRTPSQTLSFLMIYTFVCLNPYLLPLIPLVLTLFFLLVPAYLSRHPPPPTSNPSYSISGPPIAPARTIRPASEMSKDFFRNMRDLQNIMDDFSTVHDYLIAVITPYTNFSNEPFSSALFLFLFAATCLLFIVSHLLPWRFIALILGWTAIAFGHPAIQAAFFQSVYKDHVFPASSTAQSWLDAWIASDVVLDAPPEMREVEIFELQRRVGSLSVSDFSPNDDYESWIFSPIAWEPLAPGRIAGERVKGTRFFEDVQPPGGWEWESKKWELDLGAKEWVEERIVSGVEVEVEGERWVYDIEGEWRRRRWVRTVRRKVYGNRDREADKG
ncbi:hypothetical protein MMC14_005528 [Varicellaria rhodocarpa]|nr:hypothetical protein [Varicellaria rhodocarpa]